MTELSIILLGGAGITFGLLNKLPSKAYEGGGFFARMLACAYCTGFHAGWALWLAATPLPSWGMATVRHLFNALLCGFAVGCAALVVQKLAALATAMQELAEREDE